MRRVSRETANPISCLPFFPCHPESPLQSLDHSLALSLSFAGQKRCAPAAPHGSAGDSESDWKVGANEEGLSVTRVPVILLTASSSSSSPASRLSRWHTHSQGLPHTQADARIYLTPKSVPSRALISAAVIVWATGRLSCPPTLISFASRSSLHSSFLDSAREAHGASFTAELAWHKGCLVVVAASRESRETVSVEDSKAIGTSQRENQAF